MTLSSPLGAVVLQAPILTAIKGGQHQTETSEPSSGLAAHIQFVQPTRSTDEECRSILRRHQAGGLPGDIARRLLADELHRSGVAMEVAIQKPGTPQMVRDVATDMQALVFQKVIQTKPGGFDLEVSLTSSTTAWARQLLRAAHPSIARNILSRTINKMDLVDPIASADAPVGHGRTSSYAFFHSAAVTDENPALDRVRTTEDAADWLIAKSRHLRGAKKLSADAASIMHALGLPALLRPRLDERKRLKVLLEEDPALAHRSAYFMHKLTEREPVADKVDSGLLALWDDYSPDDLAAIATAHPSMAMSLVDCVLSDRARPSRNDLRSFKASVKALGTSKGWARVADELCEAFISLEFEAFSAFDSTATAFRDEKVAGRTISALRAPAIFERALRYPGHRLGSTHDEMYEQLDRFVTALTAHDVQAPIAA